MLRVVTSCSAGVCEMAGEGEVCTTACLGDCDGGGPVGVTSVLKSAEGEETL